METKKRAKAQATGYTREELHMCEGCHYLDRPKILKGKYRCSLLTDEALKEVLEASEACQYYILEDDFWMHFEETFTDDIVEWLPPGMYQAYLNWLEK